MNSFPLEQGHPDRSSQWSSGQAAYPCKRLGPKASGSESFSQPWVIRGELPSEKWVASLRYASRFPFPVSNMPGKGGDIKFCSHIILP